MRSPFSIAKLFSALIDSVLPPSPESVIARAITEESLEKLLSPATLNNEQWVSALFPYANPRVRALVRAIKYRNETVPLPALGRVASQEILGMLEDRMLLEGWRDVLMVPIPGSPERLKERGYNQADRIALALLPCLAGSVAYEPKALSRRARPSQVDVPREARRQNVEGAFFVSRPEKIRGRYILLIDDVVESGATLSDARRALLEEGALEVIAVAMAH